MKLYTVAILGATGAVGQEMMKILEERDFPVGKLIPLASARSAGKKLVFKGEEVEIQEACETAFEGVDIVLGAAENDIAKKFAPAIVAAGAVFVDNSSAFRLRDDVPLVVPEVNPEDVKWHKGIISNPNCSTIITITAVNALNAIIATFNHLDMLRPTFNQYDNVNGIITKGGASANTIPDDCEALFSLRAKTMIEMKVLQDKIRLLLSSL